MTPRPAPAPKLPTLPRGDEISSFATYLEAQKAVEALSDAGFAVEAVTIVGTDLKMVERVTGRLTYSRVAAAGLASGAWFGLFVGLVLSLFGGSGAAMSIFAAVGIGAGFGLLFSVLSFSMTRGKRDFTSASQIVATSYAVLCAPERAGEAVRILREKDAAGQNRAAPAPHVRAAGVGEPVRPGTAPSEHDGASSTPSAAPAPSAPPASHALTKDGEPRYGVRTHDGLPPRRESDTPSS